MKIKKMDNQKKFTTDSFLLASFLLSQSCELISTNKENLKRVIFVFKETKERKKLTEDFLSHKSKVEPHRFYGAQKDLKQIIYS